MATYGFVFFTRVEFGYKDVMTFLTDAVLLLEIFKEKNQKKKRGMDAHMMNYLSSSGDSHIGHIMT
jgi:hypothetical protein